MDFYIYTHKFSEKSEFYIHFKNLDLSLQNRSDVSPFGKRICLETDWRIFFPNLRNPCDTYFKWIICK